MPTEPAHRPEPIQIHVARRRTCLACLADFDSAWAGERICQECKGGHAFESAAGLPEHFG